MDSTNPITYFAETDARNKKIKFGIKAKDRLKHMYVIGKTGMGKSTLLENMAIQDIQNGEGLAFIDPHGGTAEKLLDYVPEHRIKDVLYFAPFDMEYPIAFNVMEDVDPDKRHLVVNGLMATFEKLWADAWSARMAYILQYAILALLEYPDSTLLGINKMLSDKEYRKKVVDNVTDASVKSFWIDEFGKYTERFAAEATPAIQNKVGQFTSNSLVRNIVGQSKSSFDLREMMDNRKILIINLSKGQVGEGNAKLLGSMLITKIYLAAMSRADKNEAELNKLPNFYLYVDEFQSFANKSFADILSEARKYKLNLTIAHQYVEQMEEEVRDAVFGNVGTMITFRVGALDAELLEKEFAPVFTAEDLVNLGFTQIYLKLMIDGVSSSPFSGTTMAPIARPDISFRQQVIESSEKTFGRSRKEVEEDVTKFYESSRAIQPAPRGANNPEGKQASYGAGEIRNTKYEGEKRPNFSSPQSQQNRAPISELRPPLTPEREIERVSNHDVGSKNYENKEQNLQSPNSNVVPRNSSPKEDPNKIVFAKAAQEIGSRQEAVGKRKEVETTNASGLMPNASPRVSLNDLKPDYEKAKVPTKENVSSLQQALSAVLKKTDDQKSTNNNAKKIDSKPQGNSHESREGSRQEVVGNRREEEKTKDSGLMPNASPNYFPKEIPEDVLRKLLRVEVPSEPRNSL